ncbi:DUF5668 domain-containing protein, partial [Acinetobacter baumannii]
MRHRSHFSGLVLIALGSLFLLSNLQWIPDLHGIMKTWWPLVLIAAGVAHWLRPH